MRLLSVQNLLSTVNRPARTLAATSAGIESIIAAIVADGQACYELYKNSDSFLADVFEIDRARSQVRRLQQTSFF